MGRGEPRDTKRHGARYCRTAHTGLWSDLTSFLVLHLWKTKGGPTTQAKYVTDTGICSLLLLALDVWMLQHCNKIQVLTDQEMGWLKGISAPCKTDRVLLVCSFWSQLLMGFLDSVNFIRNWSLPIRNVKVPRSKLVWSSPPVIKLIFSHLPGPPVISVKPRQLLSPPVKSQSPKSPGHLARLLVIILVTAKLLKSPGHTLATIVPRSRLDS